MANEDDTFGTNDDAINGKKPPSKKFVEWLHGQASTSNPSDLHHRQGTGPEEVSPGNHTHDGKNSMPLFTKDLVLGDISNTATGTQIATAVNAINAALRQLGAG